ncbi:SH2 domain-containing protein 2A isoform X4 [Mirounga leonina]|uniref:SH2 domain-containing protein 2A isoform X4 n=1 Tax=Mirounga leonina TaxID=9715 RepID=UPI00156BF502|nr:SH2 domain-containing protein 2A isoform X4 [Mirounga leonina]
MELPLAQIRPQGSGRAPAPTFSTFQPVELPCRTCQDVGLLQGPRLQALKAEEAQPSPRVEVVHAAAGGNSAGTASSSAPIPPPASPQLPGAASGPEDAGKAEEGLEEGGQSLQAETRAWFQKTQAHWLLQHGAAPAWFHGFITRREAERLLEPKPEGCYLVRFSESAVTFVLTYRSRTRCRHFLLAQLRDGRHVVLGEHSAHARLQDLLRHYTACPLGPYGETLTEPLVRQTPEPAGLSLSTEMSDSGNKDPHPHYSRTVKKSQNVTPTPKEGPGEQKEPPRPKPPVPAKPQLPPEVYASPAPRPRPAPPPKPSNPIYQEPDEPIAFYAMGRGSPGEAPSNVYAEVENSGGRQPHSENSVPGQGPPMPHQPLPSWGHTLPHKLSRQRTEDKGQAWLPLGPPQEPGESELGEDSPGYRVRRPLHTRHPSQEMCVEQTVGNQS